MTDNNAFACGKGMEQGKVNYFCNGYRLYLTCSVASFNLLNPQPKSN